MPPRPKINSESVLGRVRLAIKNIVKPTWIDPVPSSFGAKKAGHLKADQWRTLWTIYIPLALISLWVDGMPDAADDIADMAEVLDNAMALASLVTLLCKHTTSQERARRYRDHVRDHVEGLKKLFPGFLLPYHHAVFHLYESLLLFGPVRGWWCFPFERLVGELQDIPHNHIEGE